MIIRRAQAADFESLCHLWRQIDELHAELQPDFFRRPTGQPRTARFFDESLRQPKSITLVAEDNGQLIGMVRVKVYQTPECPELVQAKRAYVDELFIEKQYRRQGLGRALMQSATQFAFEQGAKALLLTLWEGNEAAQEFYQRLGFHGVNRVLGQTINLG